MRVTSSCLGVLTILPILAVVLAQDQAVEVSDGYDPGLCAKSNRGKQKIVKNREDKDTLLICLQEQGVYKWRMIDGSTALGEFINPAYDCSDILNRNNNAKDGFYWIHLNETSPKKVWCDMSTDSGGFILFGYQNSPIIWNVPSAKKAVNPFGSPQWSSVLGNIPILDIRVQVSKSKEFKDTISDWSFRLKNKRPLKNLMVLGEKGCDSNSPGIGDIAYVKNLNTRKIVTRNFKCSKFGVTYKKKTKYGWANMNSCLQQPCSLGFAHHKPANGSSMQVDYYGSFSYSTKRPVSGYALDATSFIGCTKGECCACYGPVNGKDEYCSDGCKVIKGSGGTVSKHAHVWFWVRTTMPKKIWRKCMEFQSRADNGQLQWYKLVAGNEIAVKGRCTEKELRLSGVAVVSDGVALNNLPRVPGLLAYQKSSDRLYLRSGSSWRTIPEQAKVGQLNIQLYQQTAKVNQQVSKVSVIDKEVSKLHRIIGKLEERQPKIRLSEWNRGRVEVYHSLYGWGTVCDDNWNIGDGNVVCRQLGFSKATAVYGGAHYGQGTGRILLDDVGCIGNENYLWDCSHRGWNVEDCDHDEDASVNCYSGSSSKIRLSGTTRGRVEVYHRSYGWGTVCDDGWDINDGNVVCRQLGFSRAAAVYQDAYYGEGSGPILLDDLACTGSENYLWHCSHAGWNVENCVHTEDASVDCE